MAFQTPITIRQAIGRIQTEGLLLEILGRSV